MVASLEGTGPDWQSYTALGSPRRGTLVRGVNALETFAAMPQSSSESLDPVLRRVELPQGNQGGLSLSG